MGLMEALIWSSYKENVKVRFNMNMKIRAKNVSINICAVIYFKGLGDSKSDCSDLIF